MKKLLLITGDLAAGKTTFASKLSKRYDVMYFFKDSFKETLAPIFPYTNKIDNKKISIAAVEIMIHIFKHYIELNKPLILESNFHEDEIEKIHKIANENGYEVLTLLVQADSSLLHQRFNNRSNNENRHPVHLSETLNGYDDFVNYYEKLRSEKLLGNIYKIDATDFSYQEDETHLKVIDNFFNK